MIEITVHTDKYLITYKILILTRDGVYNICNYPLKSEE